MHAIVVLPTGVGKTFVAALAGYEWTKGRVWIVPPGPSLRSEFVNSVKCGHRKYFATKLGLKLFGHPRLFEMTSNKKLTKAQQQEFDESNFVLVALSSLRTPKGLEFMNKHLCDNDLIIFDEGHHMGESDKPTKKSENEAVSKGRNKNTPSKENEPRSKEDNQSLKCVKQAVAKGAHVLFMSGTPWRSSGRPIFLARDSNGREVEGLKLVYSYALCNAVLAGYVKDLRFLIYGVKGGWFFEKPVSDSDSEDEEDEEDDERHTNEDDDKYQIECRKCKKMFSNSRIVGSTIDQKNQNYSGICKECFKEGPVKQVSEDDCRTFSFAAKKPSNSNYSQIDLMLKDAIQRLKEKRKSTQNDIHKMIIRVQGQDSVDDLADKLKDNEDFFCLGNLRILRCHSGEEKKGVFGEFVSGSDKVAAKGAKNEFDVVIHCSSLTEGFDLDSLSVSVICCHLGTSLLFYQEIGRSIRRLDSQKDEDNLCEIYCLDGMEKYIEDVLHRSEKEVDFTKTHKSKKVFRHNVESLKYNVEVRSARSASRSANTKRSAEKLQVLELTASTLFEQFVVKVEAGMDETVSDIMEKVLSKSEGDLGLDKFQLCVPPKNTPKALIENAKIRWYADVLKKCGRKLLILPQKQLLEYEKPILGERSSSFKGSELQTALFKRLEELQYGKHTKEQVETLENRIMGLSIEKGRPAVLEREEGDGHCGFRGVERQIQVLHAGITHIEVRRRAIDRLEKNKEYYMKKFKADFRNEKDFKDYLIRQKEGLKDAEKGKPTDHWADDIMFQAVADEFHVSIFGLNSRIGDVTEEFVPCDGESVTAVYLVYWDRIHFDSIIFK